MKKLIYILFSALLGLLLSFLVHALLEIAVINLLVFNFEKYSLGLSWNDLLLAHFILSIILAAGGLALGLWLGFRWWRYIYVEKKYSGGWFKFN